MGKGERGGSCKREKDVEVENVEKKEFESEALSEDLVLGHLICRLRVRRKKVNLSLGQICHAMKKPS